MSTYQMCTRCVMDTTAEEINFDASGVCSFCHYFDQSVKPILDRTRSGEAKKLLENNVAKIKKSGQGKPHDCILGISGGTDSSYLAYLAAELGLRPLMVNIDTGGWDSPESLSNVKTLVNILGFDMKKITIDWDEMRDLQLAFYRASVKNCEIPQDHAYLAALYHVANENNVKYILSGWNYATESILPRSWGYNAGDKRHLIAIHKRFGTRPLKNYPTLSFWERYAYYPFIRKTKVISLLDYVSYNKTEAKKLLIETFGWQDYGAKHFESVLTRFFQGYYLPTKFGIDKRKAHLSSLILSEQITREVALVELEKPPYPNEEQLQADKAYIAKRLGLSLSEWEEILFLPPRKHEEFPSAKFMFMLKDKLVALWRH